MKFYVMLTSLAFSLFLSNASWAITKGLVITIHQKTLPEQYNNIWDKHRADFLYSKAKDRYGNHIYIATGKSVEDNQYMAGLWEKALSENDIIDYMSFVHGGDQWIKGAWNVPKDSKKIRMVYSEACKGGSGGSEFVEQYGASVSLGHMKDTEYLSASPFFSFVFVSAWLEGKSLEQALKSAWLTGRTALSISEFFQMAQLIGKYEEPEQAIEASRFQFAYNENVNFAEFTVESMRIDGSSLIENSIKDDTNEAGLLRLDILKEVLFSPMIMEKFQEMKQGL